MKLEAKQSPDQQARVIVEDLQIYVDHKRLAEKRQAIVEDLQIYVDHKRLAGNRQASAPVCRLTWMTHLR